MKARALLVFQALCVTLFAYALRTKGLNWDEGHLLHPDERFLCMVTEAISFPSTLSEYFDTGASPLNPANANESRFVYGTLPVFVVRAFTGGETELAEIARTGRRISALWSAGAVLILFLTMHRLGSTALATWTAILTSLAVTAIQNAHFYTVDNAGLFFSAAVLALGVSAARERKPWLLVPAGLCVGLAMACRLNLALLAPWLGLVALSLAWRGKHWTAVPWLLLGGLLAALAFRVFQPYAFDATGFFPRGFSERWLAELRMERAITSGELEVPYTLQWVGRVPWIHALHNLAAWGLGWPMGLLFLGGTLWMLWSLRHDPGHWAALAALWPVLLIGYHGGVFLHTMRYFLPALPALALCGGLAARAIQPVELRRIIAVLVTAGTAFHTLAFLSIYRQPHPRVTASAWLLEHLPEEGGAVTYEHWDDPLPLRAPGRVRFLELPVYDPDTPEKIARMVAAIDEADFIVLSSTRASNSIPRLPLRYPATSEFYRRLTGERSGDRIGLEPVARFHTLPSFGGWGLNSLKAEEAFRVYDHPLVRVYQKNNVWDAGVIFDLLTENVDFDALPETSFRHGGRWNHGWLNPEEWEARAKAPAHAERFPANNVGNRAPVPVWTLLLFLLGVATLPICHQLFPSLTSRGAAIARPVGLLLLTLAAWFPSATGWIPHDVSLRVAVAVLLGASGWFFARNMEFHLRWLERHKRDLLLGEGLFWGVFFFFLALRWLQPELWHPWAGGEKPMNFAFLNAASHSPWFPAHNPWLSGAFINYYNHGHVMAASMIRLTGIAPETAYNLALPTFAAFTAGAVHTLAGAFLPLLRTRPGRRGAFSLSLLTVLLTLFAGNLAQIRWLLFGERVYARDGYWQASRAIRVPEGTVHPITEFPFFSHLYGDLHAHVMALPLAMICLLASWQLLRRPGLARAIIAGLFLGTLWVVNAWDFPVQAAIFSFACFHGLLRAPRKQLLSTAWRHLGLWAAGLTTARLAYAPFHWKNLSYPARFLRWDGPPTALTDLFLVHGIFLLPLFLCLGVIAITRTRPRHAPPWHQLLPALLGAGCVFLIAGVETFRLDGDIERMNTVFKFYYQVWWILALCASLTVHACLAARGLATRLAAWLSLGVFALGAVYPLSAIPAKLRDRAWAEAPLGLNGLAFMERAVWHGPDGARVVLEPDLEAIRWLQEHARPLDVVMETSTPPYHWGGRIATHTGNPTVLGWDWHMRQQRPLPGGERPVIHRAHDIERFYREGDPEDMLRIARRHQVRFVVFGELERLSHGENAKRVLQSHPAFRLVHDGTTQIHEVRYR